MFKEVKFKKIKWLKNMSKEGGALHKIISNKNINNKIILSQTIKFGRIWSDVSEKEILNMISKNHGIYEVITEYPCKVYFDIDKKIDKNIDDKEFLNNIITAIKSLFSYTNIAISGNISKDKISYHIILPEYIVKDDVDRIYLKNIVRYLKINYNDAFDTCVYSKNQNMKCVNQSKRDNRIQEIIFNENIKDHLITFFIEENVKSVSEINIPENVKLEIKVEKSKTQLNLGSLPKMSIELPENIDFDTATPLEYLKLLPLNNDFCHEYTHRIARYCFYNNISFEDFISWYKNKNDSPEAINKWDYHWKNLHKFPKYNQENINMILSNFYPKFKSNIKFIKFERLFNYQDNKKIISVIEQEHFYPELSNINVKNIIFNIGMGSGKTTETIHFVNNMNVKTLWITPNQALGMNTYSRIVEDDEIYNNLKDFKHYNKDYKKSTKINMKHANKLIICLNSLYYLEDTVYDIIIIDEIEKLLITFHNNETLKQYKYVIWNTFINLLIKCKKCILLDAFITRITIDFFNKLNYNNIIIYERSIEISPKSVIIMKNFEIWINDIINDLKNNKKIFIYYPYNTTGKKNKYPVMKELYKKLSEIKEGIMYNSLVEDSIINTLYKVNKYWSNIHFVLTNSKITVGVNYENSDYDTVYISIASFTLIRDAIQATARIRHLNSNNIKTVFLEKNNSNIGNINDIGEINTELYKSLINNILIEKSADLETTFSYFCKNAGYKVIKDESEFDKDIIKSMKKLFTCDGIAYYYSDIENITIENYEDISTRIYSNTATTKDKLELMKYYFKLKFKENTKENILADIWNNKKQLFINKIIELNYNKNNIFEDIKKYNNWSSIFPEDNELNKGKLNDTIIDRCFKEFIFKYITKTSSHLNIIKNIYNVYFATNIINSKSDGNNNYIIYIKDQYRDYYDICLSNLLFYNINDYQRDINIENDIDIFSE